MLAVVVVTVGWALRFALKLDLCSVFEFRFPDPTHILTRIHVSFAILETECSLTFGRNNPEAFEFVPVGSWQVSLQG